jgi:hypothetical protein
VVPTGRNCGEEQQFVSGELDRITSSSDLCVLFRVAANPDPPPRGSQDMSDKPKRRWFQFRAFGLGAVVLVTPWGGRCGKERGQSREPRNTSGSFCATMPTCLRQARKIRLRNGFWRIHRATAFSLLEFTVPFWINFPRHYWTVGSIVKHIEERLEP